MGLLCFSVFCHIFTVTMVGVTIKHGHYVQEILLDLFELLV